MMDGTNTTSSNGDTSQAGVSAEGVPFPVRFRWLKRFVILGGSLLVALVLLRVYWGFEANRRLQAEIDGYRLAGQPVYASDFDDALDAVPEKDNAAILLEKAIEVMIATSTSGVTIDDFVNKPELFVDERDAAAELLAANSASLELVRQSREQRLVAWSGRLRDMGWNFGAMPYSNQRAFAKLLWFVASYQRLAGDHEAAIRTIDNFLMYCEAIDSQPTVISNLVAMACYRLCFTRIEDLTVGLHFAEGRTLSPTTIQPARRADVEALLANVLDESNSRMAVINAHYGDRAWFISHAESFEKFGITGSLTPAVWDRWAGLLVKPQLVLKGIDTMRIYTLTADALAESNLPEAKEWITAEPERRSFLRSLFQLSGSDSRNSAGKRLEIHFTHRAVRRMAAIALAIRLFEADHGHRPKVLAELVPEYLRQVPVDPFTSDGSPIRFKPNAEDPILYSVGVDGADAGGARRPWHKWELKLLTPDDIVFCLAGTEKWREAGLVGWSAKAGHNDQDK